MGYQKHFNSLNNLASVEGYNYKKIFKWTRFRNLEKEQFYNSLWIVGVLDCYFGGAILLVSHTTYFISYKCGAYLALTCGFDRFWLSGFFTKYVYIILFLCNTWWCKKYALTGRCRDCHDRCSRRINSCL